MNDEILKQIADQLKLSNDLKLFELIKSHNINEETLKFLGVGDKWVSDLKEAIKGSKQQGSIRVVGN